MKTIISEKDEYSRMNFYLAAIQIAIVVAVAIIHFTY